VICVLLIALDKKADIFLASEREVMLVQPLSNLCLSATATNFGFNLCLILMFVAFMALCHEDVWGTGGIVPQFLTSVLDVVDGLASMPGERAGCVIKP
jgi:hypothetical protein